VSLIGDDICKNFFDKLREYNMGFSSDILFEVVTNYGSIGYNILLSVLNNEQLYSLLWIPDTKFRWVLLNKNGNILHKSKRFYSSKNECLLKGKIISRMYKNTVNVVIE
jgi:uncharacterized protein YegP (UPF0339 family)